jgi:molybdopterin synthase sulfur carrier subunit
LPLVREEILMKIHIRAFAQFREVLGDDFSVDLPEGGTLYVLINMIASGSEEKRAALLEQNGSLKEYVILMRNGKRVDNSGIDCLVLSDGDEIAIFPPVAGG